MRIAVDLQGAQTASRFRGIGRYVRSLVDAMLDEPRDHELVLLASGLLAGSVEALRAELDHRLAPDRVRLWFGPAPASFALGDPRHREAAAAIRLAAIDAVEPDAVLVPSVFEGFAEDAVVTIAAAGGPPTAAIVYDLVPLEHPDEYLARDERFRRFYEGCLDELRRADQLLTISAHSGDQASRHLGVDPSHIVDISAAVDERFRPLDGPRDAVRRRAAELGIPGPFYMYAGGGDVRKNLPRLVDAHASLPPSLRDRHALVLAGDMDPITVHHLRRQARRAGLGRNELVVLGHVSDDDLVALYQACDLFVFPSWSEGFGLPALEAMSCGAPVVASDRSSIPEVVDLAEARFDPYSVPAIAAAIERGLTDDDHRRRLVDHGIERAAAFSWHRTASTTLDALEALAAGAGPRPAGGDDDDERIAGLVERIAPTYPRTTPSDAFAPIAASIAHTFPERRPRKVFVDISELAERDARTGIQRVVRSVLGEWLAAHGDEVVPVAANREEGGYRTVHGYPDDPAAGEIIEPVAGDVFVALDFQAHTVLHQVAYLRFLRMLGVRIEFVVYDLLPLTMPEAFADGYVAVHRAWLRFLGEVDGVHCISRDVADHMVEFLDAEGPARLRPLAVGWFPLGGDHGTHQPTVGLPPEAPAVLEAIATRPTFLVVGTVEPRKGHDQLLDAFDALWAGGVDVGLVLVGKEGWKVDDLADRLRRHPERDGRLRWLQGVSDEYLDRCYEEAAALLVPSRGEGFGLPLVEGARHGTPILARDLPVFREVAGDHAAYFAAADGPGLADEIAGWLAAHERGEAPDPAGLRWSTWAESADALWALAVDGDVQRHWAGNPRGALEPARTTSLAGRLRSRLGRLRHVLVS